MFRDKSSVAFWLSPENEKISTKQKVFRQGQHGSNAWDIFLAAESKVD